MHWLIGCALLGLIIWNQNYNLLFVIFVYICFVNVKLKIRKNQEWLFYSKILCWPYAYYGNSCQNYCSLHFISLNPHMNEFALKTNWTNKFTLACLFVKFLSKIFSINKIFPSCRCQLVKVAQWLKNFLKNRFFIM